MFLSHAKSKESLLIEKGHSLYQKGYFHFENQEYAKAQPLFEELIQTFSMKKDFWKAYAACLQMMKEYEKSLRAWAIVALLDAADPYPHFHAAQCYQSLGNTEEMMNALKQIQAIPGAHLNQDLVEKIATIL